MGVPVITLTGQTHYGRVATSFLKVLGLEELIATTKEEYVKIALSLAQNPQHLKDYRQNLRERILRSPLCDGVQNIQEVEKHLRQIWREWCLAGGE